MADFQAGLARALITPRRRSHLIGYHPGLRASRGVHDELTATVLLLDDGVRRLALLALDLLCLHEDVVARVREGVAAAASVAPEAILVACSHTHAGPIAWAGPRSSPGRRRWIERLVAKLVGAAAQAAETLEPARLAVGSCEVRVAVNRRQRRGGAKHEGFVDPRVGILRVSDAHGAPRAVLVNAACRPAVLSPANRLITAEWPGVLRREVEARTGATCLFLQGAAGDLDPDHVWGDDDWIAMERIGRTLADAVLARVASGLEPLAGAPLAAVRETLPIPVELRRGADGRPEPWTASAARWLRVPRFAVEPLLAHAHPWRSRLETASDGRAVMPMELQALRVGDLAVVAHAAETFSELARDLRASSPAPHTFFAGCSNGMIGQLPTAIASRQGGYEVEQSPLAYRIPGVLEPEAGAAAVERSAALLCSLFSAAAPPAPRSA